MATKAPKTVNIAHDSVLVEIPWQDSAAFPLQRLETRLNRRQGAALRCIHVAMLQRGTKLKDGSFVNTHHDSIRVLLDQVADEIGIDASGRVTR